MIQVENVTKRYGQLFLDALPPILTPNEVCRYLRISTRRPDRAVANLVKRHGLRTVRIGRAVRVEREDLERFIEGNAECGTPNAE